MWGLWYALYRGYYALGGTVLLPGTPVAHGPFQMITHRNVTARCSCVRDRLPVAGIVCWGQGMRTSFPRR